MSRAIYGICVNDVDINQRKLLKLMKEKRELVELDSSLASRSVNEGFSGGEKKRNEIFWLH